MKKSVSWHLPLQGCRSPTALALALVLAVSSAVAQADVPALRFVAEMETPDGIVAQPAAVRAQLAREPTAAAALETFERHLREQWNELGKIDVVALSRYHVEATRDWQWPLTPGEFEGRAIGRDPDGAHWYLELRGPRLPASFDIVHRHLTFYARYQHGTGKLDRVTMTIRLEIFE